MRQFLIGRINILKITIVSKVIYRFSAINITLPMVCFREVEQKKFTIDMETQKKLKSQSRLQEENGAGESRLPDFILYCETTVIKTMWYWSKNRNVWNRIISPEINTCTYFRLIYGKRGKNIQWNKDSLFTNWCQFKKKKDNNK